MPNVTMYLLTSTAEIFEVIPHFDRLIKVLILPQITHEGKDSLNLAGLINQTNLKLTLLFYLHFHTGCFVFFGIILWITLPIILMTICEEKNIKIILSFKRCIHT